MSSGDDDRPKLSFSERDKRRRGEGSDDSRPRGRWAEAQEKRATDAYKKQLDSMFSEGQGGAEGEELAAAMRETHGTPKFIEACKAFRDGVGWPVEPELLGMFLDSGEEELVVGALEAILDGISSGQFELPKSLRTQIAVLAEDFNSSIADVAEEIIEQS